MPRSFEIDLPLVADLTIKIERAAIQGIKFDEVSGVNVSARLEAELLIRMESDSRIIPSFQGRILLISKLDLTLTQPLFEIKYSINNFKWLEVPVVSKTGRKLPIIRKLSSAIINGFATVEKRIQKELSDLTQPNRVKAEIGKWLQNLGEVWTNPVIKWTRMNVFQIYANDQMLSIVLALDIELTFTQDPTPAPKSGLVFGSVQSRTPNSLSISQDEITQIVNNQIDSINKSIKFDHVQIENMLFHLFEGGLSIEVRPKGVLTTPFDVRIELNYNTKSESLELENLSLSKVGASGLVGSATFWLMRGKIRDALCQAFPINSKMLTTYVYSLVEDFNNEDSRPVRISLSKLKVQRMAISEGSLDIKIAHETEIVLKSDIVT